MSVLNLQYRYVSSLEVSYPITGLEKPLGLQEIYKSAHKSGEVVSPTHRPFLPPPPQEIPWYSYLLQAKSTAQHHIGN
jgi:hypothetical protein